MKLRVIFIGTVEFSYYALKKIIELDVNIVTVLTKKESKINSDYADLVPICIENNINYKLVSNINHVENVNWIKKNNPDVIFCFGWSYLLSSEILNIPRIGVVGYHPAKLPYNRGRHPLIWALVLGLKETGSTFFFMDEGADSGDILSQRTVKILDSDNAYTLYKRMIKISLMQIEKIIPKLESGSYERIPQDLNIANYWRKREVDDGEIDWRMSAETIHNLIRGLSSPYVGAHFMFNGKFIKVWSAEIVRNKHRNIEPGKVLSNNKNGIIVKTGEDSIRLIKIAPKLDKLKIGSYL